MRVTIGTTSFKLFPEHMLGEVSETNNKKGNNA